MYSRCLSLVFVAACFGPSVRPAYQKDVEVTLAGHAAGNRDVGPRPLQLQPWRVGQWALYRTSDHGKLGYQKVSVVATDDCGIWIEQVTQDAYHRSISKVCYRSMPELASGRPIGDAIDLVQVMVTRGDSGKPMVWDFRQNPAARDQIKVIANSLVNVGWIGDERLAREDVAVPAGRFAGSARWPMTVNALFTTIDVTAMIHTEVPVWGLVRTSASNGMTTELVDYGQDGAVSAL